MLNIDVIVKDFFSQYPNHTIIIAYSGGVDSQVLLHVLATLKQQHQLSNSLHVCHVNHGLSANASAWQNFAEQQCQTLELPLTVCNVDVQAKAQHSLEALARDARYQALQQVCTVQNNDCLVVTGHHGDDQAETFLLALKRGAGLKGLSAMATIKDFANTGVANSSNTVTSNTALNTAQKYTQQLARPFLNISRADILNYAKKYQLDWVEDESNTDESFDRNFIRHQVMPLLAQRWPSVLSTFARSAQHCQSGQELLDELAEQDLQQCRTSLFTGEQGLEAAYLQSLSIARFNNLVRFFLAQAKGLMPSVEQLAQLHQQLFAQADKTPMVKVGQYWLRRFQSAWYLTDDFADISAWQIELDLDELKTNKVRVNLPDNVASLSFSLQDVTPEDLTRQSTRHSIKAPQLTDKITLCFNHNNPRCLPDFRQNSRSLKKVLQELEIPPWQRKRIAFLYYNEELVAALGYFVCKTFLPKNDEKPLIISSSNDTN